MTQDTTTSGPVEVVTCICPGGDVYRADCPVQHFGTPGYGFCIPHMVDAGELVAALGERREVGLCGPCLAAFDKQNPPS